MSEQASKLWEKLDGIKSLKRELTLRLALLGQSRHKDQVEMMVNLSRIDEKLESAYVKVKKIEAGTVEEEAFLSRIRDLEDKRFQLLSVINGDKIAEYSGAYPH